MAKPVIEFEACDFEINVRFRVDDIGSFLDVPDSGAGPKRRATRVFGDGWRFELAWSRKVDGDDGFGVWLKPPKEGYPRPVYYSLHGESLQGKHYFAGASTFVFPPKHNGRGWRFLLTRTRDWDGDDTLRAENAVVIVATIQTPPGPRASSKPTLDCIYQMVAKRPYLKADFITFSRRTPVGLLISPSTFSADCNMIIARSTYLYECLGAEKSALMYQSDDIMVEKGITGVLTDYMDADSDFDAEEEDEEDEEGEEDEDMADNQLEEHKEVIQDEARVDDAEDFEDIGQDLDIKHLPPPQSDRMQFDASASDFVRETLKIEDSNFGLNSNVNGLEFPQVKTHLPDGHIVGTYVVTGVASPTWAALIFYLYTGTVVFAPLTSEGRMTRGVFIERYRSRNPHRPTPCSCKSMFRLAHEMGIEELKDLALGYLKSRLSAQTILSEIFSAFTSQYDAVKTLELAVLTEHWDELNGSPALADRLAESTSGNYPHASWILAECLQRLAAAAKH
ncbi:hypothetical protein B0H21DRAFT_884156 [Amylocystis lapponica]|nr:hypothetical protein B0H21DRAFT_884156 [Amylocystis lapponica]